MVNQDQNTHGRVRFHCPSARPTILFPQSSQYANRVGIECRLPGGNTANDYITLSRSLAASAQMKPASPPAPSTEISFVDISPLAFLFHIGETLDEVRAQFLAVDIQNTVWSFHPVCLVVEAGDEFFSFACGFFAAIMRRRALMVRHRSFIESTPLAPEVVTVDRLKRLLGQIGHPNLQEVFPKSGAIYILRENPEDVEDDEIIFRPRLEASTETERHVRSSGSLADGSKRCCFAGP